jgi:hypothetical protein
MTYIQNIFCSKSSMCLLYGGRTVSTTNISAIFPNMFLLLKIIVFWDLIACSVADIYRPSWDTCCFHLVHSHSCSCSLVLFKLVGCCLVLKLGTDFTGTQTAATTVQPDADAIPVGSIQGGYVGPGNLGQKSSRWPATSQVRTQPTIWRRRQMASPGRKKTWWVSPQNMFTYFPYDFKVESLMIRRRVVMSMWTVWNYVWAHRKFRFI